jgi:hypothetical protein
VFVQVKTFSCGTEVQECRDRLGRPCIDRKRQGPSVIERLTVTPRGIFEDRGILDVASRACDPHTVYHQDNRTDDDRAQASVYQRNPNSITGSRLAKGIDGGQTFEIDGSLFLGRFVGKVGTHPCHSQAQRCDYNRKILTPPGALPLFRLHNWSLIRRTN